MLSKQITQLRKKAGMSQSQLARQLSVSPSTIGMYEQGRRTPDLETIVAMAAVFRVSLDYLITGAEPVHSGNAPHQVTSPDCPCSTCFWRNK